jgi:hypothetical protein
VGVWVCVWGGVGIINQLGPDNLEILKRIAGSYERGAGDGVGILFSLKFLFFFSFEEEEAIMKGCKYMMMMIINKIKNDDDDDDK